MSREQALAILAQSEEVVSAEAIALSLERVAGEITRSIGDTCPLVLSVMGGATVFTGMLLPRLAFPLEFDTVHLTRYSHENNGDVQWRVAPARSVKDRVVLVLDELLDDGRTMAAIRQRILELGASRFLCAVLCDKDAAADKPLHPDFRATEVPARHVFGCGMDAQGYWRNLPSIRALKPSA